MQRNWTNRNGIIGIALLLSEDNITASTVYENVICVSEEAKAAGN